MLNRRCAASAISDPRFIVALATLLLNDLYLKTAHAGIVSGKLSDFAGIVVFPVVAASLLAVAGLRVRAASVIVPVTVWFTLIQLSDTSSNGHEWILSSMLPWSPINTPDPTDLIALPMAFVAFGVLTRPRPVRIPRAARATLLAVGALACVADSAPPDVSVGPARVNEAGELEVLVTDFGDSIDLDLQVSNDSGATLTDRRLPPLGDDEQQLMDQFQIEREACLNNNPQHCFELAGSPLTVRETTDGGQSYRTAWHIKPDYYLRVRWGGEFKAGDGSLLVLDDDTVIYTTGSGPVIRRTAQGQWTPTPVGLRSSGTGTVLIFEALLAAITILTLSRNHAFGVKITVLASASVLMLLAPAPIQTDLYVLILPWFVVVLVAGVTWLVFAGKSWFSKDYELSTVPIDRRLMLAIGPTVTPVAFWILTGPSSLKGLLIFIWLFSGVAALVAVSVSNDTRRHHPTDYTNQPAPPMMPAPPTS